MNSMSSQHCRPVSTQSITSTDSADSEENYVAMVRAHRGGHPVHSPSATYWKGRVGVIMGWF